MLGTAYWTPFVPGFEAREVSSDDTYRIFYDTNGRLMKQRRDEVNIGIGEFLEFPVKCKQDWENLKWRMDPQRPERYAHMEQLAGQGHFRPDVLVMQNNLARITRFTRLKIRKINTTVPKILNELLKTPYKYWCFYM